MSMQDSDTLDYGEITIEDEVIFTIVQRAVLESEEVAHLTSGLTDKVLGRNSKGIKLQREETGELKLSINVAIYYGQPLLEVANQLQKRIRDDLTMMTGLEVASVDIHIQHIIFQAESQLENGENHEKSE